MTYRSRTWLALAAPSRDERDDPRTGHFPEARATSTEDLDELARDWLTYWLLDMGTSNFEERIAGWDRPEFLRMPDLALPTSAKALVRSSG
jgi:hypothetical protein